MSEAVRHSEDAGITRMIAMGTAALMQGFALIGFETYPDADKAQLSRVLSELLRSDRRALVLLEPDLARCDCDELARVRFESGRIVVTEIPPLHAPSEYHPLSEERVVNVLGPNALEEPQR